MDGSTRIERLRTTTSSMNRIVPQRAQITPGQTNGMVSEYRLCSSAFAAIKNLVVVLYQFDVDLPHPLVRRTLAPTTIRLPLERDVGVEALHATFLRRHPLSGAARLRRAAPEKEHGRGPAAPAPTATLARGRTHGTTMRNGHGETVLVALAFFPGMLANQRYKPHSAEAFGFDHLTLARKA